jgi:periplasmic protein TonB
VLGGGIGGVAGSAGPPPPPTKTAAHRVLRVGGEVKLPKLLLHPEPLYPQLAKVARVEGTGIIDAIIDEKRNVVEAHMVSDQRLLIPAALQDITPWKYEPTYLDVEPVSARMHVNVNFSMH